MMSKWTKIGALLLAGCFAAGLMSGCGKEEKNEIVLMNFKPEAKEAYQTIADEYYKDIPEFAYRLKVRGGLTGYAQIYGKYNTSAYDKLRLDLMYIENYSLLLDIKLIILTLRIIFSKESTEGIDKQQENQGKIEELLREMDHE